MADDKKPRRRPGPKPGTRNAGSIQPIGNLEPKKPGMPGMVEQFKRLTGEMDKAGKGQGSVIWRTLEECDAAIEDFFQRVDDGHEQPTMGGLAVAMGTTRAALLMLDKNSKFYKRIKLAKTMLAHRIEGRLYDRDQHNGAKFYLQANERWTVVAGQEVSGPQGQPVRVSYDRDLELLKQATTPPSEAIAEDDDDEDDV